jgi:hypothetical protein
MGADLPLALFKAAQIGLGGHVLCTVALRLSVETNSAVFEQLFSAPILGGITRAPWLLRAKYFFPWVPAPEDLAEYTLLTRVLFWGARLGGTVLLLGLVGFLSSAVYIGVGGQK